MERTDTVLCRAYQNDIVFDSGRLEKSDRLNRTINYEIGYGRGELIG